MLGSRPRRVYWWYGKILIGFGCHLSSIICSADMIDDMRLRKGDLFCWGSGRVVGRLTPIWVCKEQYLPV